jgi:hypothetical protein
MDATAAHYLRMNKEVNVLGEHKSDKWVNEKATPRKPKVPKVVAPEVTPAVTEVIVKAPIAKTKPPKATPPKLKPVKAVKKVKPAKAIATKAKLKKK